MDVDYNSKEHLKNAYDAIFGLPHGKKFGIRQKWDFFPPVALQPNAGHGLLILEVSGSHTTTHHSR
jgi:hypothetical protein